MAGIFILNAHFFKLMEFQIVSERILILSQILNKIFCQKNGQRYFQLRYFKGKKIPGCQVWPWMVKMSIMMAGPPAGSLLIFL